MSIDEQASDRPPHSTTVYFRATKPTAGRRPPPAAAISCGARGAMSFPRWAPSCWLERAEPRSLASC